MMIAQALRRILTQNLALKTIALGIAIALFALVRGSENVQRAVYVDVVAIPPPETARKILISELPAKVKVTLRGSTSQLSDMFQHLDEVAIDISDPSRHSYYFEEGSFDLPPGVTLVSLAPAFIPLVWADRKEREIPVEVQFGGDLSTGLELKSAPGVRPAVARVSGPSREISAMVKVRSEAIPLDELGEGHHEVRARFAPLPEHSDYVDVSSAEVSFDIVPQEVTRSFEEIAVTQLGGAQRFHLRPGRVRVRLRGSPPTVEALSTDEIVPFADVSDLSQAAGATAVDVQIQTVPAGVEVLSIEPPQVFVTSAPNSRR